MNTASQYNNRTSLASAHKVNEAIAPTLSAASMVEIIEQVAEKFVASLNEAAKQNFNGRLDRGLELAKNGKVTQSADAIHSRRYLVRSSDGRKYYLVDLEAKTCDCPDSLKGNTCKHRVAAYYYEQAVKANATQKPAPSDEPVKPAPHPVPAAPASSPVVTRKKTEDELLRELGFTPQSPKSPEPQKGREPGYTLGSLYRRYLHGTDLMGECFTVTIQTITKEKVKPHPSQPAVEKWCLTVSGLPVGMPNKILFGAKCEEDLVAIFGSVSIDSIMGKQISIYPKPMNVAGQQKITIRFRSAK